VPAAACASLVPPRAALDSRVADVLELLARPLEALDAPRWPSFLRSLPPQDDTF
jgi:hypothetical protein